MRLFLRTSTALFFFALFALPIAFVGHPESPAYLRLQKTLQTNTPLSFAIIGDSRAHTGISPSSISHTVANLTKKNLQGHNFAVDGTDILHHYSFVKNGLLKTAARPSVVLWTPNPLHFNETRVNNRLEQLYVSDVPGLFKVRAPFELMLDILTMGYFKPWQHKPLFTHILSDYTERAGLRTLPIQQKVLNLTYTPETPSRRYTQLPDGQEPFEVLEWADRFNRGADAYKNDYAALKPSEWHFKLSALLAKELANNHIKLVIIEMPVSPWFQKNLASTPKHLHWRQRMQSIAQENGALFLDHSAIVQGDDTVFGDPGHMPKTTATLYSKELAKILVKTGVFEQLRKGD